MKVLFVNCCMKRGNDSRTKLLCNEFFAALKQNQPECEVEEVILKELDLRPLYIEDTEKRDSLLKNGELGDPMFKLAHQFAEADKVVIGAPYWDMAFPSLLKVYIEHIYVEGITFEATEKGLSGLSRAKKALFIQTAGGYVGEDDPGTAYLKYALSVLGVSEFKRISADFIDIYGVNVQEKLDEAAKELKELSKTW